MRFTYTQAYQHLAVRNRVGEKDVTEKFHVISILRKSFGLHGLTGEVLMIDKESYRLPDILIKNVRPIVIELEGEWHGVGDQVSKLNRDVDRDKDYHSIGAELILIYKEQTDHYSTDKVIKVLEENGLKRI